MGAAPQINTLGTLSNNSGNKKERGRNAILIVDDNPMNVLISKRMIENMTIV